MTFQHLSGQQPQPLAGVVDDLVASIDVAGACKLQPLIQFCCVSDFHA